jgi:hypothetical protein
VSPEGVEAGLAAAALAARTFPFFVSFMPLLFMLQPNIYLMVANLLKIGTSKRAQNDPPPHLQTI